MGELTYRRSAMSPEERRALEQKADRSLRRGELGEALASFRRLVDAFPDDASLRERLAQLEQNLQPAELLNPKAAFRSDPSGVHASPMHQAEALAAKGDFAGAIALYRQLLATRPDWDLVKERLAELFQLAQASEAPRSVVSREHVLEQLLDRISTRRKP